VDSSAVRQCSKAITAQSAAVGLPLDRASQMPFVLQTAADHESQLSADGKSFAVTRTMTLNS